ncbi:MAG TPA: hypothetical protein VHH73_11115, partial [Verrucomicrobiae bacterium]|nr:hypothetical protein [Verrucomicrobiae bacterium]
MLIRAMALEAVVGKDRQDVAAETDRFFRAGAPERQTEAKPADDPSNPPGESTAFWLAVGDHVDISNP